jgi:hypothetical protein
MIWADVNPLSCYGTSDAWSCCEKLGGLLKKLDVHQVDHPVFTGKWAKKVNASSRVCC